MKRFATPLIITGLAVLSSCQTIEPFSIDYVQPATISFPQELRNVGIVNNAPQPVTYSHRNLPKSMQGDGKLTAESLAESLADANYFNQVIICDSALQQQAADEVSDIHKILTQQQVKELTKELGVDFLISVEDVNIHTKYQNSYYRDLGTFYGTIDAYVQPIVRVYVPQRDRPLITVQAMDSIFWEKFGDDEAYVNSSLPATDEILNESSSFAGTIPVERLVPTWKKDSRFLFAGGNVNMRDAVVYVREENWKEAIRLWNKQYTQKKGKSKMKAAFNMAVGYEMMDSLETAHQYALKAQALARQIEKIDERQQKGSINQNDIPYYLQTSIYVNKLEQRTEHLIQLNAQMSRFKEDFQ